MWAKRSFSRWKPLLQDDTSNKEGNSLELGDFLAENRIGSRFRHAKRLYERYNIDAISINTFAKKG